MEELIDTVLRRHDMPVRRSQWERENLRKREPKPPRMWLRKI
jgi:hypothetical protein